MPTLSTSVEMLARSFERKTFVSGRSVTFDLFDDPERDRVTPISLRDITHPFRTTVNEVKFLSSTRRLIHSPVARLEWFLDRLLVGSNQVIARVVTYSAGVPAPAERSDRFFREA